MSVRARLALLLKVLQNDEYSRYLLAEAVSRRIYPKYKFSDCFNLYMEDTAFIQLYERFMGKKNTYTLDRKYILDQMMQLVLGVEGDTAECGAFQGASSYFMCRRIAGTGKKHHVFDSFEGLSKPQSEDGTYWQSGNLASAEAVIRDNLREFDFVVYHSGWIPEKFHEVAASRFSFVHIDVDLYQPTLESMSFFYERLSPGGIILCDDYGSTVCPGAKLAVDSFMSDKPEKVVMLPSEQAFVIKTSDTSR
ncbi:MAG: class I SAM-dependent methyltransferase [Anaerolineae bacterium]|nr:class I SAM-dependent methyltransferase [Anaerolineae bacterium]